MSRHTTTASRFAEPVTAAANGTSGWVASAAPTSASRAGAAVIIKVASASYPSTPGTVSTSK